MTQPQSVLSPLVQPRRRLWRRPAFWTVLVLVLALAGPYVYVLYSGNSELDQAIAEADRLDPGWRLQDLEQKRLEIPDKENSALTVMAAHKLMPYAWPCWGYGIDPENRNRSQEELEALNKSFEKVGVSEQLNEQQIRELRRELKRADKALAEARNVIDMPHGRYPVTYTPDVISTSLLNTQNARALANLLDYDALLRAQDQDSGGALASCRCLLNVSRSVGDEPMLISMLVRVAVQTKAVFTIERILTQTQAKEQDLAALQRRLAEEAEDPLLLTGLRGERAMANGVLQAIEDGKVSCRRVLASGSSGRGASALFEVIQLYLLPSGSVKHNRAAAIRFETRLVEAAKLPIHEQRATFAKLEAQTKVCPCLPGYSPQRSQRSLRSINGPRLFYAALWPCSRRSAIAWPMAAGRRR